MSFAAGECIWCQRSQAVCAFKQNCAFAPSAASNRSAVSGHTALPLHNLVHALQGYTHRPRELNLGDSKRTKEFLEQQLAGMCGRTMCWKANHDPCLMVVFDADVFRSSVGPPEADPILFVDSDAVIAFAVKNSTELPTEDFPGMADFTMLKQRNVKDTVWTRFTWPLRGLNVSVPIPTPYRSRSASSAEAVDVLSVVLAAYASDPVWQELFDGIRDRMTKRVNETLGKSGCEYIVVELNERIVAVSGVARSHWTDQNLLTGICVAPQHQRRGLGTYLLAASLLSLRDMGLATAQVYTEAGSLADRKIYPLFGSRREEGVEYPGLRAQAT